MESRAFPGVPRPRPRSPSPGTWHCRRQGGDLLYLVLGVSSVVGIMAGIRRTPAFALLADDAARPAVLAG